MKPFCPSRGDSVNENMTGTLPSQVKVSPCESTCMAPPYLYGAAPWPVASHDGDGGDGGDG